MSRFVLNSMMMKKIILLLFCIVAFSSFAQTNLNWKVGRHSSIDFSSGQAVINITDTNKSLMTYSNTSVCDRNGKIIFYSNACKVYNRNGDTMPNGGGFNHGIYSDQYVNTDYYPVWKAATIIPFPNDSNKFYLFYLNMQLNVDGDYIPDKLYYLVVDRTLNGGLGDVTTKDQIAISNDTLGKSTVFAIQHGNGKDWWIIVRKHKGNKYYKILVDSNGVHNPTTQILGNAFNYPYSIEEIGNISFQGDKLCYLYETLNAQYFQMDLLDFDRCSGVLSVNQSIFHPNISDTISWGSSCFSKNENFLYLNDGVKVYQADITVSNLLNSIQVVGTNSVGYRYFFKMELAPDNKIYVAPYGSYRYMSIIHAPDSASVACRFVENAIQFGATELNGPWADGGLPNNPNFSLGAINCNVGVEGIAKENNGWQIYPNPASSVISIRSSVGSLKTAAVVDLQGRKFENLKMSKFENEIRIEVSNLSSGIYFIKITDDKGNVSTKKFVKE